MSEEAKRIQREMAAEGLAKRLREIEMSEGQNDEYENLLSRVENEIKQLRVTLDGVQVCSYSDSRNSIVST